MFSYQMVSKEINEIFDIVSVSKSAAYEAMIHSQSGNDSMCEVKMKDLDTRIKEVMKQLTQLRTKIDYMKSQG